MYQIIQNVKKITNKDINMKVEAVMIVNIN